MMCSLSQNGKLDESITDDIEGESLLDVVEKVSPTSPQLSCSEVDALL